MLGGKEDLRDFKVLFNRLFIDYKGEMYFYNGDMEFIILSDMILYVFWCDKIRNIRY